MKDINVISSVWPEFEYVPSSFCDERPENVPVSLLVIHNISLPAGSFGTPYVTNLFTGKLDIQADASFTDLKGLEVSSHLFIRRDGQVIQYVPFDKRAWHAGVSSFQGQTRCNDFAIGIEVEGTDTDSYTDEQYAKLVYVSRKLMRQFPHITLGRIVGHNDIAFGRKTDPGASFDWCRYRAALKQENV
jgi:AmpD protein